MSLAGVSALACFLAACAIMTYRTLAYRASNHRQLDLLLLVCGWTSVASVWLAVLLTAI